MKLDLVLETCNVLVINRERAAGKKIS